MHEYWLMSVFLYHVCFSFFPVSDNVIVSHCKLHNDASCDISQDGCLLATFVPTHRGFPDDTVLAIYSLQEDTLGQCLYTKGFGEYF